MNEYQKAYDRLAFNFGLDCLDEKLYPEEVEDFELFRELVERETPKKIQFNVPQQPFLRKKYGKNARYDGICPNCHKSVYPGYKYCTNCVPEDWKVSMYETDMDKQINCAECGKPMKYGESLTSQRIYDDAGLFGYAVCWDCHTSGLKERMEHESSD